MNSPRKALLIPYSNYNITLCFIQIIDLLKKNWNTFQIFGYKGIFQAPH